MAEQSTQSIVIDASASEVMAVIADFPAYPQWVGAAKKVEVLEAGDDGRARQVHFVIDAGVIKDDYVLDYTWDGDRKVSWKLVKGELMKRQEGASYFFGVPLDYLSGRCKDTFTQVMNSGFPGGLVTVDEAVKMMDEACKAA